MSYNARSNSRAVTEKPGIIYRGGGREAEEERRRSLRRKSRRRWRKGGREDEGEENDIDGSKARGPRKSKRKRKQRSREMIQNHSKWSTTVQNCA